MSRSSEPSVLTVVGLTGSLASGKSTVARIFASLGAKVLDADRIAHRLLRPGRKCYRLIIKAFGKEILKAGKIDRRKIAELVFQDRKKLRELEKIIHPEVRKEILAAIGRYERKGRKTIVILDVPLLYEAKLDRHVDLTIVVKASRMRQIERARTMLNITRAEAQRRIKAQMPLRQKIRKADIIIDNNGTIKQTKTKVKQIWERL